MDFDARSTMTSKTGLSSILKPYSPIERNKIKNAVINKVRFDIPKKNGLLEAFKAANELDNPQPLSEFFNFLRETHLEDHEFIWIYTDARKIVNELNKKYRGIVETLLSCNWVNRSAEAVQCYVDFSADIMVAQIIYIQFGITKLLINWIPSDVDAEHWLNGNPTLEKSEELEKTHKLLDRILTAVPMSFDVTVDVLQSKFPYYKRPPHVIAGYIHNLLRLTEYKPMFREFVIQLILQKLIILDVNAPRQEIEESDCNLDDDDDDAADDDDVGVFEMDDCNKPNTEQIVEVNDELPMNHPIANTLDVCMEKMMKFLEIQNSQNQNQNDKEKEKENLHVNNSVEVDKKTKELFKFLLQAFDYVILPSHNTHHVQFLIFYYTSFKLPLAEAFLSSLWEKVTNPNVAAVIRQTSVGYIASFLARSKFLPLSVVRNYIKELCVWAHQYIDRCDQYRLNCSLKANLVFYTVCQAIFYVIAFRSRDLTADKKDLQFLQSLHLSALVTCNFNPLRVCLPVVATAFAGVTRAYQLAYCHAILERNARRKLATVYAYDTETPEETLDTFFPFDPYLLKISVKRISPIYLQYQASEAEEVTLVQDMPQHRKRGDSEMADSYEADFLCSDKKRKCMEMSPKSNEKEAQFIYGFSPGFHF